MRAVAASIKLFLFILLCTIIVPTQSLVLFVHKGPYSYILPKLWHKGVCLIFGIRIQQKGQAHKSQTIYMSNHISYLDIPLLGGILTGSFVAKSEVEGWPVFGFLSKLQRTAFIVRKTDAIRETKNELQERLENGESLIIFPEGTSSDGLDVVPLKSSLFQLAIETGAPVQPITITLEKVNGAPPRTTEERRIYTWPLEDEIEVHDHLWRFAKSKGVHINIRFHDVLHPDQHKNRKVLAQKCHEDISQGLPMANAA